MVTAVTNVADMFAINVPQGNHPYLLNFLVSMYRNTPNGAKINVYL
jgi:hypothetical protein